MNNQEAITLLRNLEDSLDSYCGLNEEGKTAFGMAITALELFGNSEQLPSAQPDIIHCKDCEYLCNEDGLRGMCWHINGFGTDVKDKYNSFCSWAERREK